MAILFLMGLVEEKCYHDAIENIGGLYQPFNKKPNNIGLLSDLNFIETLLTISFFHSWDHFLYDQ